MRVNNLCGKITSPVKVNPDLFKEPAEQALFDAAKGLGDKVLALVVRHEYGEASLLPLELTEPVNKFFDDVMVMDKDETIKNNRLALLDGVQKILNCVGDLSKLVL